MIYVLIRQYLRRYSYMYSNRCEISPVEIRIKAYRRDYNVVLE